MYAYQRFPVAGRDFFFRINLDSDDMRGLVWRLAFPSMLAQFVSVFYSIVDRMYIGNIAGTGEIALAGVGICGPIVTLISSVAFLVGVGGSPLMSIRLGEKNERAARQILANCFLLLTVLSAAITVIDQDFYVDSFLPLGLTLHRRRTHCQHLRYCAHLSNRPSELPDSCK